MIASLMKEVKTAPLIYVLSIAQYNRHRLFESAIEELLHRWREISVRL